MTLKLRSPPEVEDPWNCALKTPQTLLRHFVHARVCLFLIILVLKQEIDPLFHFRYAEQTLKE